MWDAKHLWFIAFAGNHMIAPDSIMIHPLEGQMFRQPNRGQARVIAIFSYRYDAHLVPALIENIRPFVHGYAAYDDRGGQTALTNEPNRRVVLNTAALGMGADWVLAVDPDERLEKALADQIDGLTQDRQARVLWTFMVREMYTPTAWRADGIWGSKSHMRLYPAHATRLPPTQALHGQWVGFSKDYTERKTGLNLYHLRHIEPMRGQHRRDTYAAADPDRLHHPFGYDYLADTRGCRLETIPADRGFHPAYVEDGGLWAPPQIAQIGPTSSDPLAKRLAYMAVSLRRGGVDACSYVAGDFGDQNPQDDDMRILSAGYALWAGRAVDALAQIAPFLRADSPPLLARMIAARAHVAMGQTAAAQTAIAALRQVAGGDPWVDHTCQSILQDGPAFADPLARWRRWTGPSARILEGAQVGTGRMAVIIIGFRAQSGLARAVASIRDHTPDAEIVVVNSGGGDVRRALAPHLPFIRLIEVMTPLFVGAARNIGVDASRAAYVAFLAGDCVAAPGWIAARLARHDAGALSVSTPVQSVNPRSVASAIAHALYFRLRDPKANPDLVVHFGRSYARTLLDGIGAFAPGLRVGEDDEFNRRVDAISQPVWTSDALTLHENPSSTFRLLIDTYRRARRAAVHLRALSGARVRGPQDWVAVRIADREKPSNDLIRQNAGLGRIKMAWAALVLWLSFRIMTHAFRREDRRLKQAERLAGRARADCAKAPEQARKLILRAIALAPQSWQHPALLAQILDAQGDTAGAQVAYQAARALAPAAARPVAQSCQRLIAAGRVSDALECAEQAVTLAPSQPQLLIQAALAADAADRSDLALAFAQLALMTAPSLDDAHDLLADLHEKAGAASIVAIRRQMAEAARIETALRKAARPK